MLGLELSAETFKEPQMRGEFLPVEMLEHGERHELVGIEFETVLVEQREFLRDCVRQSRVEGQDLFSFSKFQELCLLVDNVSTES